MPDYYKAGIYIRLSEADEGKSYEFESESVLNQRNTNTSIQNNFNHYNKNKRGILDKVYYVDEFGIEYWHGEPIESKEATKEE